jgi:alkaline phosphatase
MHRFVNRRQLLRLSAAFASAPAILPATARSAEPHDVIFMVSDGMSAGVIPLAEAFSQVVRGRGTVWHDLLQRSM